MFQSRSISKPTTACPSPTYSRELLETIWPCVFYPIQVVRAAFFLIEKTMCSGFEEPIVDASIEDVSTGTILEPQDLDNSSKSCFYSISLTWKAQDNGAKWLSAMVTTDELTLMYSDHRDDTVFSLPSEVDDDEASLLKSIAIITNYFGKVDSTGLDTVLPSEVAGDAGLINNS